MKISITTGGLFERFGIEKSFSMLREAGFDCVDLQFIPLLGLDWYGNREGKPSEFFNSPEMQAAYVKEINDACEKTGIAIGQAHAPFPLRFRGLDLANSNNLEYAKICIRMTAEVGCKHLIIYPYFEASMRNNPTTPEEEWEGNMEFYGAMIPDLKKYGVTCCLENMWGQDWRTKKIYTAICSDAAESARYIDALNEMAGQKCFAFCLDTGHMTLLGLDNYRAIKVLGSRIEALHISDNTGNGDDHTMPYTGVGIWERVLKGLSEIGYEGNINFETVEADKLVPVPLIPEVLRYTACIGKYFDSRLAEMKQN